ncbi:uncharacterized protein [Littorina saxatilis]|uniref:uncharacterized protein isoform X2 n=1 Tax=Littorina saxatilis TaxID=31220 RepID=UPI0038B5603C
MYRHRYGGSAQSSPSSSRRGSNASSSDMDQKASQRKPGSRKFTDPAKPVSELTRNRPAKVSTMTSKALAASQKTKADAAAPDSANPSLPKTSTKRIDSTAPKDLMISYSHADKEMMVKVREKLEQNGISVWVDVSGLQAGVDFLSKIGEAIIDAKLFISLLSINCIKSRYCQDELALAYVSDTAIFPVAIQDPSTFKSQMDTGMKLQLARYKWTILDENNFDEEFARLVDEIKEELKRRTENTEESGNEKNEPPKLERAKSRTRLNKERGSELRMSERKEKAIMPDSFWNSHFKNITEVDIKQFDDVLFKTFKEEIDEYFTAADQDWLKSILSRELEVEEDGKLYKYNFDAFCRQEGMPLPVWERVLSQAMESYAMKDVFNMESSVRVEAIENLGKFRSAAVIDALRDLLSDPDANVRAVASVSLARTEANDPVTLKFLSKTLNDKDRLVREAGCLALGHLRAKQTVAKLLHLWRNDVISHVREAAHVALQQIGGPEVEKAMHVTKVLADEIRQLTAQ